MARAASALYTVDQAAAGAAKYVVNCAQCHGKHLEGRAGPALTGANFASEKANFKLRDIFVFISTLMPAQQPGSLPKADYVDIMSFLLQQNGYPAGSGRLTMEVARVSEMPLRFQGKPAQTALR